MEYYDRMKRITVVDTLLKHSLTLDFEQSEKGSSSSGSSGGGGISSLSLAGGGSGGAPRVAVPVGTSLSGTGSGTGLDGDYLEWKEALISNLRLYTALVQNAGNNNVLLLFDWDRLLYEWD